MAKQVGQSLDFGNTSRLLNVPNPVSAQEPATRAYVDANIEGLAWKDNARVATQSNINLAAPGATIDGSSMSLGDRFVARAQTDQTENGIYIWNGAAVAASRSLDASTFDELENAIVSVDEGTSAGSSFRQTQINGTLASSNVIWVSFGVGVPAASETIAGTAEIATQAEVDAGLDDARFITPAKLAAYSGRIRKYVTDIGDGSATQYVVTHNLNTRDVQILVYRNSSPWDDVLVDTERTTVNTSTIRFAAAPTSNQYRVVVMG